MNHSVEVVTFSTLKKVPWHLMLRDEHFGDVLDFGRSIRVRFAQGGQGPQRSSAVEMGQKSAS